MTQYTFVRHRVLGRFKVRLRKAVRSKRFARSVISVAVFLILYWILSEIALQTLPRRLWVGMHYVEDLQFFPTYASLAEELVYLSSAGLLFQSVAVSTTRVLEGLLLGCAVGMPMGLLSGWVRRLHYLVDPWLSFFRFTPALALLPLYTAWFGREELTKLLLIATGSMIVMWIGSYHGVRDIPRVYLQAARTLGIRGALLLRRVVLPSALPQIFSSLRIAIAMAWTTIVVAELIHPGMPSLGYLLTLGSIFSKTTSIAIGILLMGLIVLLMDFTAMALYNRTTGWMKRVGP